MLGEGEGRPENSIPIDIHYHKLLGNLHAEQYSGEVNSSLLCLYFMPLSCYSISLVFFFVSLPSSIHKSLSLYLFIYPYTPPSSFSLSSLALFYLSPTSFSNRYGSSSSIDWLVDRKKCDSGWKRMVDEIRFGRSTKTRGFL